MDSPTSYRKLGAEITLDHYAESGHKRSKKIPMLNGPCHSKHASLTSSIEMKNLEFTPCLPHLSNFYPKPSSNTFSSQQPFLATSPSKNLLPSDLSEQWFST